MAVSHRVDIKPVPATIMAFSLMRKPIHLQSESCTKAFKCDIVINGCETKFEIKPGQTTAYGYSVCLSAFIFGELSGAERCTHKTDSALYVYSPCCFTGDVYSLTIYFQIVT